MATPTACPARPTRCRQRDDAARQADLHRQVGRADVDAQLQARARDDRPELARLERGLDGAPPLGVEGRVVGGDRLGRRPGSGAGRA